MSEYFYQPKGSMCASCEYRKRDCSSLPFQTFQELERYTEDIGFKIVIVKCKEYHKRTNHE